MTNLYELYRHCPYCGSLYNENDFSVTEIHYDCSNCGNVFYLNSSPSAVVIIPNKDDPCMIALIERLTPPGIGLLALPGGFLNYNEPAEAAATRETMEETGIAITINEPLGTTLLDYLHNGYHVSVLEHAFITDPVSARLDAVSSIEVKSMAYYNINDILQQPEKLSFREHIDVIARYRDYLKASS